MITEDYVSFETAKLLKEKGFDERCTHYYKNEKYLVDLGYTNIHSYTNSDLVEEFAAPTLQMAMKWLREVHKISIEITSTGYLIDNDVEWECDIKAGHRLYFRHITNEESFESCAEAAIRYCLENLI